MKRRGKNTPPLPVYARVDLTTGGVERFPISEKYFKKYVGGKCLAARLLLDLTPPGLDPLSPEAVIIINTGPLNGTGAPSTSRFNLSFKNVLTGGIASSNCGGQFGVMLKRAGFDGLIITGRATGLRTYTGPFLELGERSYALERLYNLREGLTAADDALPKRLTRELQDPSDPRTAVPIEKMLPIYYRVRGWDAEGRPTAKKLRRLGIEEAGK